jgi:hypothetical protein
VLLSLEKKKRQRYPYETVGQETYSLSAPRELDFGQDGNGLLLLISFKNRSARYIGRLSIGGILNARCWTRGIGGNLSAKIPRREILCRNF